LISHVLDTNVVIALANGRSARLSKRFLAMPRDGVALSSVVAHELYYGALRSQRIVENLETIRLLTADMPMLDFDANDALVSGEVRAFLAAHGKPIGPYDNLIAGQAKARGLTVVTNNVREFSRVPGLKVEDWTT
jgi:tRNA(fMet)-specific endonuclease VapC